MGLHGFIHRSSEKLLQNSGFSIGRIPFFSSKVFSRAYRHFGGEKIEKKTLSKKVDGSPWIHPIIFIDCIS
jgi:hypothetical protein